MLLKDVWNKALKIVKIIAVVFVLAVIANVIHPSHKEEPAQQTAQTNTPNSVKNINLAKINAPKQETKQEQPKQETKPAPNYKYIFKQDFARFLGVEIPYGANTDMSRIGNDFVIFHVDVIEDGQKITVEGLYYAKDGKLINFKKGDTVLYYEK